MAWHGQGQGFCVQTPEMLTVQWQGCGMKICCTELLLNLAKLAGKHACEEAVPCSAACGQGDQPSSSPLPPPPPHATPTPSLLGFGIMVPKPFVPSF